MEIWFQIIMINIVSFNMQYRIDFVLKFQVKLYSYNFFFIVKINDYYNNLRVYGFQLKLLEVLSIWI